MSKYTQNVVSMAVWPWQVAVEYNKGSNKKRIFKTTVQVVSMIVVGLLLSYFGKRIVSVIIFMVAGVVMVCGLFIPPAFRVIDDFGKKMGYWVAIGLTWVLLVPFFFICFVPARLILGLQGKDPLTRTLDPSAESYWVKRKPIENMDQYRKQH